MQFWRHTVNKHSIVNSAIDPRVTSSFSHEEFTVYFHVHKHNGYSSLSFINHYLLISDNVTYNGTKELVGYSFVLNHLILERLSVIL